MKKENIGRANIVETSGFKKGVKKLKKEHRDDVIKDLKKIIKDLSEFKISSQKKNHPLKNMGDVKDIHVRGDIILLYRYVDNALIIDLELLDLVSHKELKNPKKKKGIKKKLKESDDSNVEKKIEEIENLIEDIYALRQEGLAEEGEFSLKNLVFKEFRNRGYLDNLKELKDELKSKKLSLEGLQESMKVTKEDVIERYKEYVAEEFDEKLDEVDDVLGLMFTQVGGGNEYDVQVSYDLNNEEILVSIDVDGDRYTWKDKESLEDFYDELEGATFDGYYSWAHEIVENELGLKDIEF